MWSKIFKGFFFFFFYGVFHGYTGLVRYSVVHVVAKPCTVELERTDCTEWLSQLKVSILQRKKRLWNSVPWFHCSKKTCYSSKLWFNWPHEKKELKLIRNKTWKQNKANFSLYLFSHLKMRTCDVPDISVQKKKHLFSNSSHCFRACTNNPSFSRGNLSLFSVKVFSISSVLFLLSVVI